MKNLLIVLLLATSVAFTSCEKQTLVPDPVVQAALVDGEISLFGTWELVGGTMYVENIETHQKVAYQHFDSNKIVSSLRYEGSEFNFKTIEVGVTKWTFTEPYGIPGHGEFWLNQDSINPMGLYITQHNWTIVEHPQATANTMQLGGSARPFHAWVDDFGAQTVNFYVQEAYMSDNGYNYKYFSELTFKKL